MNKTNSLSNEFKLLFLRISDIHSKKEIGSYLNKKLMTSEKDLKEIKLKFDEIQADSTNLENNKLKKQKFSSAKHNFFFYLNKNNILFLAASLNQNAQPANENSVFELIEDVEHQGILKQVDKNKELTNVGKQNLVYLVEKYLNDKSRSNSSGEQSFENNTDHRDKIINVTNDVNEVRDNVKSGIKNLLTNLEIANDLDNKAMRINDNSLLFKKDSEALRKQTQWRNRRFMIALIIVGLILGTYVLYKLFG